MYYEQSASGQLVRMFLYLLLRYCMIVGKLLLTSALQLGVHNKKTAWDALFTYTIVKLHNRNVNVLLNDSEKWNRFNQHFIVIVLGWRTILWRIQLLTDPNEARIEGFHETTNEKLFREPSSENRYRAECQERFFIACLKYFILPQLNPVILWSRIAQNFSF